MLTTFIVPACIFAVIAFWCFISFMISLVSGWRALAHRFRATAKPAGTSFFMERGYINSAQYNGCLSVVVSDAGLFLAVLPIFPGHAPILVPYSEIAPFKERKMMWLSLWDTKIKIAPRRNVTLSFSNKNMVAAIEAKRAASEPAPNAWSSSSQPPIPFISDAR